MDWFERMKTLGVEVERSLLPGFRRRLPDGAVRPLTNVEMQAAHVARITNPNIAGSLSATAGERLPVAAPAECTREVPDVDAG